MGKVLKRNASNAWFEYSLLVEDAKHGATVEICGLCGNSGMIDTRGNSTWTDKHVGISGFCICPNGRMAKKTQQGKKWGGSSVTGTDSDGTPCADGWGWE